MTFSERLRDLLYGDETVSAAAELTAEEKRQVEELTGELVTY